MPGEAISKKTSIFCSFYPTRTNLAITPCTLTYIINEFKKSGIEIFNCSLIEREAFRAIRSFGGTIENLDSKEVSGKDKAIANVFAFTEEVKIKLLNLNRIII